MKRTFTFAAAALALCTFQSSAQAQAQPQAARQAPIAAVAPSQFVTAPQLPLQRFTLDNGLEVIVHEDHRSPAVTVNVWYHVGSKDEPRGRNGFAHLFEHLMFQGSRHVPEDKFFEILESIGATSVNGTTGDDRTNYFETVPRSRLATALWLESDRMGFLLDHVDQRTFENQREVVLNEYRQNYENAPYGAVWRILREAVFPQGHPYHRLAIGTPQDLAAATLDDVRRFFRTFYVPNNATLVLAGDITLADARTMVTQYFGPIPRGPQPPRREPGPARPLALQHLDVEASVELPRVVIAWQTPRYFAPGDAELDVIGNLLSNGQSSRLFRRLVRQEQVAVDVSAFQNSMELASMFVITATLRPNQSHAAVRDAIDEELATLVQTPVQLPEFDRARYDLTTSLIFGIEAMSNRADRFNLYRQHVGDPDYLARDVARYLTPTPATISSNVGALLPSDHRVTLFVHPVADAPVAGRLRAPDPSAARARLAFGETVDEGALRRPNSPSAPAGGAQ
ncbi:MAG: pitrilysin family protein [Deltaproteobacteria bacterium]|nr:pitrilysin family protein [Deltaproteobacteria bacterium]